MITAYLVGISNYIEDEDIEIRYCIFKEEELLCKESIFKDYRKPLVVTHVALVTLLKKLKDFDEDEITVIINDAALYEQLKGTSTTKNKHVIEMAKMVRGELKKFGDSIKIKDVSNDSNELRKWNEILEA